MIDKYEVIKMLIEELLEEYDDDDEENHLYCAGLKRALKIMEKVQKKDGR